MKNKIKYILKIDGMMCGMCEAHVNDVIRRNFDIKKVKSNARKNQTIVISDHLISEEEFHKVIDETGYIIISINKE